MSWKRSPSRLEAQSHLTRISGPLPSPPGPGRLHAGMLRAAAAGDSDVFWSESPALIIMISQVPVYWGRSEDEFQVTRMSSLACATGRCNAPGFLLHGMPRQQRERESLREGLGRGREGEGEGEGEEEGQRGTEFI